MTDGEPLPVLAPLMPSSSRHQQPQQRDPSPNRSNGPLVATLLVLAGLAIMVGATRLGDRTDSQAASVNAAQASSLLPFGGSLGGTGDSPQQPGTDAAPPIATTEPIPFPTATATPVPPPPTPTATPVPPPTATAVPTSTPVPPPPPPTPTPEGPAAEAEQAAQLDPEPTATVAVASPTPIAPEATATLEPTVAPTAAVPTAEPTATAEPTVEVLPEPTPTPPPTATPAPTAMTTADMEWYMLEQINEVRASAGLAPVALSAEISIISRDWSAAMASAGGIAHRPSAQLSTMLPSGWRYWGENVASAPDILWAQSALENSPDHYKNMVGASFTHVGLGVVVANGSVWVTQNFASY